MTQPIPPPVRTAGITPGLTHQGVAAPQHYQPKQSFPLSQDTNPSFTDLIRNRCYSFAAHTNQPARNVSLEDLVTELLTPSSDTDVPGRKESIENIVKTGGRVALVTEDDGTGELILNHFLFR
jgi:hypothetical protein